MAEQHLEGTLTDVAGNVSSVSGTVEVTEIVPEPPIEPPVDPPPVDLPPGGKTIDVPAPSGSDDRGMIQALIDKATPGTRVVFKPDATYKLGGTLVIASSDAGDQGGITLDGNDALLDHIGPSTQKYRNVLRIGGGPNNRTATDCVVQDLRLRAVYEGDSNWGHGVNVQGRSSGILVSRVTVLRNNGDAFYVGDPGENHGGPHDVLFEDCVCAGEHRRHGGTVTQGYNVTWRRCTFQKKPGGSGGTTFDIEPLNDGDHAHHILFEDCEFGYYPPSDARRAVQCNGSGAGDVGAYVSDVTVRGCRSKGNYLGMVINSAQQQHPLFANFVFEDNVSDPAFEVKNPMVKAVAPVDGITVKRNKAPLGAGSFISAPGCTNVVVGVGADANVDTG